MIGWMSRRTGAVLGNGGIPEGDIDQYPHVCDAWLNALARCSGINSADIVEKLGRILRLIPGETFFCVRQRGGPHRRLRSGGAGPGIPGVLRYRGGYGTPEDGVRETAHGGTIGGRV